MTQYYRQIFVDQKRRNSSNLELKKKKITETDEHNEKECIISSTELGKKYSEDDIEL